MFPWAEGRSLRDFWDSVPLPNPCAQTVYNTILQLRGIADALHSLHNFDDGIADQFDGSDSAVVMDRDIPEMRFSNDHGDTREQPDGGTRNIRHGDLKPENILKFHDAGFSFGSLKIADLGLAKQHVVATQDRKNATSMRYGTLRYEAPETVTALKGRSRLYDIWSMGCITLEFVIWLLFGNNELNTFYSDLKKDNPQVCQYYEIHPGVTPRRAEVRRVVVKWMDYIEKSEPEGRHDSAIRDLVEVVRKKLLVVPLPPRRPSTVTDVGPLFAPPDVDEKTTNYRATALQFRDALDRILGKAVRPEYLFEIGARAKPAALILKSGDSLSPAAALRPNVPVAPLMHIRDAHPQIGHPGGTMRENYTVSTFQVVHNHVSHMSVR